MSDEQPTAYIVDVDGTLVDVSTVRHFVLNRPKDFDAFHLAARDCPPNREVIEACERAYGEGHIPFVLTARRETWRPQTVSWLNQHMSVPYSGPIMRKDDDFRKGVEVKRDMYTLLTEGLGLRVVGAIDDDPRIAEMWESLGVPTQLVPGWDEWAEIQRANGNTKV